MSWRYFFCLFILFEEVSCSDKNKDCLPQSVEEEFVSNVLIHLDDLKAENRTHHFTLNLCSGKAMNGGHKDVAVLQQPKEGNTETVIGSLDEVGFVKGSNWALLVYGGGDEYGIDVPECHGLNRSAYIHINCDLTQSHNVSSVKELISKPGQNPICFQLFTIASKYVCDDFKEISPSSSSGISFFGIFFILLFIIIVLYFSIGVIYKRIAQDAQGWEQLPNSELWIGIGERCVSALDRLRYGNRYSPERYYNNIETTTPAFEQEENDDRLLTM